MQLIYRTARPDDGEECVALRGKTRQNPASEEWLRSIGVTAQTWSDGIRTGAMPGHVCTAGERMVGYSFGDRDTGEIIVVAVLPEFENLGVGREVLDRTVQELARLGHKRLFLGCNPDSESRSHGFYRHLGWKSTDTFDEHGDEILELYVA